MHCLTNYAVCSSTKMKYYVPSLAIAAIIGFYLLNLPKSVKFIHSIVGVISPLDKFRDEKLTLEAIFDQPAPLPFGVNVYSKGLSVVSINNPKEFSKIQIPSGVQVIRVHWMTLDRTFSETLIRLIISNSSRTLKLISFVNCIIESSDWPQDIDKCGLLKYFQLRNCTIPQATFDQLLVKLPAVVIEHLDLSNNVLSSTGEQVNMSSITYQCFKKLIEIKLDGTDFAGLVVSRWIASHSKLEKMSL